ncbi:hemolysin family protein [Agromyces indicus]|uniref:Hemolysin family protein n=1 Tax=Agromyces indicus TaxID=758919 RepID=A0ABU1FJA2_9MICO|nr:hemolysin family protein [Agromyces indicus]MDR5691350.1 hemolysin family protein [Agromyces indicus]
MITALLLLLLGLLLTAAIIAANGYFVAQEFAYMSVDRARLRARAEAGDAQAARALAVTKRTSFMLSGAQLGITVTGLLVGYVAEPFIGESLGVLLGGVGVPTAAGIAVGTVFALALATVVQMIFGELYPKNLAIANPEPLARALARSTQAYLAVFGWLIALFDRASNAVLRLIRVEPVHDIDISATAADLEHIIDDSRASGDLPAELSILLDRVLDFPDRDVEHAMIPRVRVDVAGPETTIAQIRTRMVSGHTRYPVLGEREEPVGVVHLADVLAAERDDMRPVTAVMREPLVVPTLMPLPDALAALTGTRNELACVIDEYGGFSGIVTIEDLAEELIGEIDDEHDTPAGVGAELDADGAWVMDGDLHLDEVERIIDRDLPRGDYETMAGLIIAQEGSLPDVGETVRVDLPTTGAELAEDEPGRRHLLIEVAEVDRHVPSVIKARVVEEEGER